MARKQRRQKKFKPPANINDKKPENNTGKHAVFTDKKSRVQELINKHKSK